MVPETRWPGGVDAGKEGFELGVGEGRYDLIGQAWQLDPVERILGDDLLGHQPGEEDADAAQVSVDGVNGESTVLGAGEGMVGPGTAFAQGQDEGSQVMGGDGTNPGIGTGLHEVVFQVLYASGDDGDGRWALALAAGTQSVACQK